VATHLTVHCPSAWRPSFPLDQLPHAAHDLLRSTLQVGSFTAPHSGIVCDEVVLFWSSSSSSAISCSLVTMTDYDKNSDKALQWSSRLSE
jgi:hypothetical protein